MKIIDISTDSIKLDQFLKWSNVVSSGGEAKILIKDRQVEVNGNITTQRGLSLKRGDIIKVGEEEYQVE